MTSGADLFVVCKQCGSEVSPYITECPYCGNRLRRRAPKLPRANVPSRAPRRRTGIAALLRRAKGGERPRRAKGGARPRRASSPFAAGRWSATRPYATIALVSASCAAWIVFHASPSLYGHMALIGPLHGEWWKLFTSEFAYVYGLYAFFAIVTIAIFGWLLEQRHGPVLVLALFFGAGVSGALVAAAVYRIPIVSGGNAPALALLAAWAVPDLRAARSGGYYEGELIGAGAIAALLLAMPFARGFSELSWLAGIVGAVLGLLVGLGAQRLAEQEL
jgi:membrane associated rhomboid family serine protease